MGRDDKEVKEMKRFRWELVGIGISFIFWGFLIYFFLGNILFLYFGSFGILILMVVLVNWREEMIREWKGCKRGKDDI
jgi:hypothetical protein